MKYLQNSINALSEAIKQRTKSQDTPVKKLFASEKKEEEESECSYEEAEGFVMGLVRAASEERSRSNLIKRKVMLFERIEVEPHYLQATSAAKLIEFQFQLGTHCFPERTEALYLQVAQLNRAIREITKGSAEATQQYFIGLQAACDQIQHLIERVTYFRSKLAQLHQRKQFAINHLLFRKKRIKEKLSLLRNVKTKNQAAFLEITNIDQAFATEQQRVKLYHKLTKLTELQRSKYVGTIRARLIATSRNNKSLVQEGISQWLAGGMSEKQIEKLVFMVYFMEKEEIYRDHQIRIEYTLFDKTLLRAEIMKIFSWSNFHYMREASSKERIHQFLHFLLTRIE